MKADGEKWSVQTHGELFNSKGNHITGDEVYQTDEDVDITKVCPSGPFS